MLKKVIAGVALLFGAATVYVVIAGVAGMMMAQKSAERSQKNYRQSVQLTEKRHEESDRRAQQRMREAQYRADMREAEALTRRVNYELGIDEPETIADFERKRRNITSEIESTQELVDSYLPLTGSESQSSLDFIKSQKEEIARLKKDLAELDRKQKEFEQKNPPNTNRSR